jgi:hypothetical protein
MRQKSDPTPVAAALEMRGIKPSHRHRAGTTPVAVIFEPSDWQLRVTSDGRPIVSPRHGWALAYNPLSVRETFEWLRDYRAVSAPTDAREFVELATHAGHLEARARSHDRRSRSLGAPTSGEGTTALCYIVA